MRMRSNFTFTSGSQVAEDKQDDAVMGYGTDVDLICTIDANIIKYKIKYTCL